MTKSAADKMTVFVAAFGALLTLGAYLLHGATVAQSTGLGALVAFANFSLLRFIVVRVVEGDIHRKLPFLAALFIKMGVLMWLVYFLIAHRVVEPIAFTAGLSALVAGLITASFMSLSRTEDAAR